MCIYVQVPYTLGLKSLCLPCFWTLFSFLDLAWSLFIYYCFSHFTGPATGFLPITWDDSWGTLFSLNLCRTIVDPNKHAVHSMSTIKVPHQHLSYLQNLEWLVDITPDKQTADNFKRNSFIFAKYSFIFSIQEKYHGMWIISTQQIAVFFIVTKEVVNHES